MWRQWSKSAARSSSSMCKPIGQKQGSDASSIGCFYVGRRKRRLKDWVAEHKNVVRTKNVDYAMASHYVWTGHSNPNTLKVMVLEVVEKDIRGGVCSLELGLLLAAILSVWGTGWNVDRGEAVKTVEYDSLRDLSVNANMLLIYCKKWKLARTSWYDVALILMVLIL